MRDKVVIITGASSGIGKALVFTLARQGAKIAMAARRLEELLVIEEELKQTTGAEIISIRTDVTKEQACKELIEQTYAKFGRIDVLINNAQASASGVTLADHTQEQFDLAMYSGLYAVFYYMQSMQVGIRC